MNPADLKNYLNKILVFYLPEKAGYWNSITHCSILEKPVTFGKYYLDFSSKANYDGAFSEKGIPLSSFSGQKLIEHPTVIAQYALGIFAVLIRNDFNDDVIKKKFLVMADWLQKNKVEIKNGKGWLIEVIQPEYGLNEPWISAMTQEEAISVLTRAAWITNNKDFENLAEEALIPFEYDVKDGGVVNYFMSIPVYEEAPTPEKTSAVLNGFIFSLFGLYDLVLFNQNMKAQDLFNKGVDSLKKLLPYFDSKFWSLYRLYDYPKKYYSSYTYHALVAEQLKSMYYLTGEEIFIQYSKRWTNYSKSFFKKTYALFQKICNSNDL